ncbi:hypothetical protein ACGYST_27325, partial [Burkholderia pseudomallei]
MPQPIHTDAAPRAAVAAARAASPARPRSNARYRILALLAFGTMINYLDRTVLGVAAPGLTKELGIGAAAMGVMFSAFSWTYQAVEIGYGVNGRCERCVRDIV